MTHKRSVTILGLTALLFAGQADAQPQCAKRDWVLSQLEHRFGETRRGVGLASNNAVMEVFASDTSGTWTITLTTPDGTTCLMASGLAYETLATHAPAKGDPA